MVSSAYSSMPERWAVEITCEENSFHRCKDLVFCPPYLWSKIDSQLRPLMEKWRHHLISRDLIWIKIVVRNYLQTDNVIILVIRFAVFINCILIEIIIQLNSQIGFRQSPNPRLKHLLSNCGLCDVIMQQYRHKWLSEVMNVVHSNRFMLPMQGTTISHE